MKKGLNVVDYTFITLILLIIFGIVFKIFFVHDTQSNKQVKKNVYYNVENIKADPDIIKYLKVGDYLYNNYDKVDAYITNIKTEPATHTIETADGRVVQAKDYSKKELVVSIKANLVYNKTKPYFQVGSQDLIVGKEFTLKTKKAIIRGTIISIK